ncbi:unnamed protein product [Brachionus calyciflorus]|uniref:FAM194 C-terminal domain-containing protein n=1 Tax=Brachionus calyciflorus TaxID=104777 RepID=A0A814FT44_9BILA|nr:unnamed protein product [Brachionus calyciflorus]
MSDYNEISESYTNETTVSHTARSSRPKILSNFRRESNSSQKAETTNENCKKTIVNKSQNGADTETQTDWSWIQDMELIKRIKREGAEIFEEIINDMAQSSDSEAELDLPIKIASPAPLVESVGPPKLLQFNSEIKKSDTKIREPSPPLSIESEPIGHVGQFMQDFNVQLKGGQKCEFCGEITKPWPDINKQELNNPETLHCCNDYQEFVEALIQYQIEKEEATKQYANDAEIKKNKIKNAKARKLAEERAELRNMQRMLEKHKRMERIENLRQEKQQLQQQLQAKQLNVKTNEQTLNQNRSINYQLSNIKCLQDGWTVRPTSPIDMDLSSLNEEEFNLNARNNADPVQDKNFEKPLIIRRYKNENFCLILFSDGTGNIFYPSGRVALSITEVSPGMHLMSAFTDDEINPILIASFDPYGNGCANFLNGNARVVLSSLGGFELDADGNRKKRWLWWEPNEHVHAPPFQSLIFSLNPNISIKIINQEKIYVDFYAENQVCKFRVGSKLKLKRPDSMPPSFKVELSELYLKKKRKRIEDLIKLMNNEVNYGVKLPKITSPKEMSRVSQSFNYLKLSQDKKDVSMDQKKQKSNKFITVP